MNRLVISADGFNLTHTLNSLNGFIAIWNWIKFTLYYVKGMISTVCKCVFDKQFINKQWYHYELQRYIQIYNYIQIILFWISSHLTMYNHIMELEKKQSKKEGSLISKWDCSVRKWHDFFQFYIDCYTEGLRKSKKNIFTRTRDYIISRVNLKKRETYEIRQQLGSISSSEL